MRHWIWTVATFAGALCFAQSGFGQVIVRFDPPNQTVNLGDTFGVDLVADIQQPVVGWGLDLTIQNPAILSLADLPHIASTWFAASSLDGDNLAGLAFPESVSGNNVVLATIFLTAGSIGQTDLLLSVTPGDLTEGFALDPSGFASNLFESGRVTVTPEPSGTLFLVIGIFMTRRGHRMPC